MQKKIILAFLIILNFAAFASASEIYETIGKGDNQITVLYLKGSPYQMGYIQGSTFPAEIAELYNTALQVASQYASLTLLDIAYNQMEPFIPQAYKDEMQGLADGAGVDIKTVHRLHAVPDLSELDCTFFAAWGSATKDGQLYQIRALDYAKELLLQKYPAILVYEPEDGRRFVNVSWLGFIGVVTGMNYDGIMVSEIGDSFDKANQSLAGEPMPFVLRDVLQYSDNLDDAVKMIEQATRTSSYLFCVGDAKIPDARSIKAGRTVFEVYTDQTNPNTVIKEMVYFSMGITSSWNTKVYQFLKPRYGQIDVYTGIELMQQLGTGDLHAISYDPTHNRLFVANAGMDQSNAFDRDFVEFDLSRADTVFANYAVTAVESKGHTAPHRFSLAQNYPNPFNSETKIEIDFPAGQHNASPANRNIKLVIYDMQGRNVRTLSPASQYAGHYTFRWNGRDDQQLPVPSGLYLYTFSAGNASQTKKMILIK